MVFGEKAISVVGVELGPIPLQSLYLRLCPTQGLELRIHLGDLFADLLPLVLIHSPNLASAVDTA